MTYRLDSISIILTDDKKGFEKINEIYEDIFKGNIPLITNNKQKSYDKLIPLGKYENYKEDEYIFTVFADKFHFLMQIYKKINNGDIMKFEGSGKSINQAEKMPGITLRYIGVSKEHLLMILKQLFQNMIQTTVKCIVICM